MEWPTGKYGAIYCDPPWRFEAWSGKGTDRAADNHYDTMKLEDMKLLQVNDIAADDCVLFMWIVWPMLPEALDLIKVWGFKYKTCAFSWIKADGTQMHFFREEVPAYMGLGYWTRANSEVCLLGTKGSPKRLNADVKQAIIEPKRQHSRKPDIYSRIERLVAGPYIELFSRTKREGWDVWGNEVGKFHGT